MLDGEVRRQFGLERLALGPEDIVAAFDDFENTAIDGFALMNARQRNLLHDVGVYSRYASESVNDGASLTRAVRLRLLQSLLHHRIVRHLFRQPLIVRQRLVVLLEFEVRAREPHRAGVGFSVGRGFVELPP